MSYDNRLPDEQIAALKAGDTVVVETIRRGWRDPDYATARITRLTPTQIVVTRVAPTGATYEQRFRRKDAREVGSVGDAQLVDANHPVTTSSLASAKRRARQQAIDILAHKWSRDRDDLDALRRLHTAIGQHLDTES